LVARFRLNGMERTVTITKRVMQPSNGRRTNYALRVGNEHGESFEPFGDLWRTRTRDEAETMAHSYASYITAQEANHDRG